MLKEALEPFCETLKDLRPALAEPFRQQDSNKCDYVMASDGHVLIRIKAKEAGVAVGKFKKMDEFDAHKAIPFIGFNELLNAWAVSREDIVQTIAKMKAHEEEMKHRTLAELYGVKLSMEALSHIDVAMRICGAEQARLVWHEDFKVLLQLDNGKHQDAVSILHMGMTGDGTEHIFHVAVSKCDGADFSIDWQRGAKAWADIKAEQERKAEEERMARREVYLVQMVKVAYIPVYAKDADEARRLADSEAWFDPEDDGDDQWMLGDEVPEAEDLDMMDDCYQHVITRDGVVERDEIYELDQISEEWQKKQETK